MERNELVLECIYRVHNLLGQVVFCYANLGWKGFCFLEMQLLREYDDVSCVHKTPTAMCWLVLMRLVSWQESMSVFTVSELEGILEVQPVLE